jgi:hypothetical protein
MNPILSCFVSICKNIRNKRPNKFWKSLLKDKDISIVFTEYQIIQAGLISRLATMLPVSITKNLKIVNNVSDGYLVSRGNAKALSNVAMYLSKYVKKGIFVDGDNYIQHKEDLVILGSPVTNKYARRIYRDLTERYDIPFEIIDDEERGIKFVYKMNEDEFKPEINSDGDGQDYAIIVNAEYQNGRNVVILAGAYMYGTEAASNAVTNKEILKTINEKKEIDINNCIFLIKTIVVQHTPKDPTLVDHYIFTLNKKN